MRFKLLISLVLILGWTYSGQAQEKRSLGDSLYSSKLPSRKLSASQAKKGKIPVGTTMYNTGLLSGRGTSTTTTYKPKQDGTSLQDGTSSVRSKTFSSRPWLGQSLYKKMYEKDKPDKPQSYQLPSTKKKDEYSNYYSNIFYKGKESQPEVKDEEVNPFMRR
ncbi:MAG: hypothetical protein ABIF11_01305 [Nitrospirota bacterium]